MGTAISSGWFIVGPMLKQLGRLPFVVCSGANGPILPKPVTPLHIDHRISLQRWAGAAHQSVDIRDSPALGTNCVCQLTFGFGMADATKDSTSTFRPATITRAQFEPTRLV